MSTIDNYIPRILNEVPDLDKHVIKSLRGLILTIQNHVFLTKGQSEFCLNLLKDNQDLFSKYIPELTKALDNPTWSKPFRSVENIKRMFITFNEKLDRYVINIESNYSNSFRNYMASLVKILPISVVEPGKNYISELSENNIITLVDNLSPLGFDIDDDILNHYNTITSWNANDIINQYTLSNIINNIQPYIDNGFDQTNPLIVEDRKLRYQYCTNNIINTQSSLVETIATRSKPQIWINSSKYTLTELVSAIQELNRLPILFVFDKHDSKKIIEELYNLSDALDENNITDTIGIYFRLENSNGKAFNEFIHHKNYNAKLEKSSKIAAIETTNLPKFFLTSDWEPMTVISIGNNLRNTKISTYSKRCDLIVTYAKEEPMLMNKTFNL